ncbi:MAG: putative signal transduction histidine kinase [Variovorax sp.]|nr:putative signal transduction histidine kinase [Variovorax sp.]
MVAANPGRLRREWLVCLAVVLAFAALIQQGGWLGPMDRALYDRLLAFDAMPPPADILIVAVDDRSLQALGGWPWSRDVHAALLKRLAAAGPRAVALDVIFAEPTDPAVDRRLAQALADLRAVCPVFLPVTVRTPLASGRAPVPLRPLPALEEVVSGLGHIHVELDSDNVVRSLFLREGTATQRWPALSLRLASASDAPAAREGADAPVDGTGWLRESRVLLPFSGPAGHYKSVPYAAVLNGEVPDAVLRGKTVLVGLTATGIGDQYPTPFSGGVGLTPGVEINATALDGLLRGRLLLPVGPAWQIAATALALIGWMLWLWRLGPRAALPALLAFGVMAMAVSVVFQLGLRLWLPVSVWCLAALLGYLLWSWRRLAVLMRDLYLRADAMQVGTATSNASARAPQDGWGQVVDALDRGRDAERQMQQQRAEALQLLSHDLRAPQSAILALLQGQPSTDEERALLNERIERQVRTSLGLADDFVLQMRARDDRYVLQDVDLAQLMTEVYERAWPLARKRNLKLVLTLPGAQKNGDADTAYWLPIEPRLMARAFFNLIENAIKYSRESGRVEFALEGSSAGPVVVTVTDEGVGIAAEDLPRLFDRYSRFNAASGVLAALPGEAESAGHGLGLSLVKTVVERHGGTVACRSELGYGTLFTVTLPRPSAAEPTPSAASA